MKHAPQHPRLQVSKGLPPGALIHIGERKIEKPKISVIQYKEDKFIEFSPDNLTSLSDSLLDDCTTWIDISGIHDAGFIQELGAIFQLDNLSLEDIMNTQSRAKYEEYDNYILILVKDLFFQKNENIGVEQISFILKDHILITFQEKEGDAFDSVRNRIRNATTKIRTLGSDYLTYALIDAILDNIFVVTDTFEADLNQLENELTTSTSKKLINKIQITRKRFTTLRRAIVPIKEVVFTMSKTDNKRFTKKTHPYLRDLYDHTLQVAETIEQSRDTVLGLMSIYQSGTNQIMNNIMKTLTVISTIFMALSLIAGIYGMNFKNMPELYWEYGYFIILGMMAIVSVILIVVFKMKKWLD